MLYRLYPHPGLEGRDTLARGVRGWHNMTATNPSNFLMTSQAEIPVETFIFGNDTRSGVLDTVLPSRYMGLPSHITQIPSLPEHNGGRFTIPSLVVEPGVGSPRDSVEVFARALNRLGYGANVANGRVGWPYGKPMTFLGTAAWVSRRTGRRVIQYVGVNHLLYITWVFDPASGDYRRVTVFSHQQEAPEIRLSVNLGLCYGSRGIHYSVIGAHRNQYVGDPVRKSAETAPRPDSMDAYYGRNYVSDFSPVGFTTLDTARDTYDEIHLGTDWQDHPKQYDTLRDYWTGWRVLSREVKWINRFWVPRIYSVLRGLHWRDGYSIHFTVPQSYYNDYEKRIYSISRPLPPKEIVAHIEARDRWGRTDPAEETFVELGLFDARRGALGGGDTNYIMVVNRRTFERPLEVPASSPRGRLMDSLTEIRTLAITFNITHPADSHYSVVRRIRVRELAHDPEPLVPGSDLHREPLDTVINGDGAALLTLRPGGAALLEITSDPADGPADGVLAGGAEHDLLVQPNPVRGTSKISFSIPRRCRASLAVFDGAGREVRRVMEETLEAGRYVAELGADLPSGSYVVELRSGASRAVRKIVVLR
jgi:hypothetical protein